MNELINIYLDTKIILNVLYCVKKIYKYITNESLLMTNDITIDTIQIKIVDTYIFLGLYLDTNLSFNIYIYIYILNDTQLVIYITACVAQWLMRQIHKQ